MTLADKPAFGDLLRRARKATGLSQEELAERAHLSPRTVSDLERGVAHHPYRDTVALLADALGLAGVERTSFEAAARNRVALPSVSEGEHPEQETRAGEQAPVPGDVPPAPKLPSGTVTFLFTDIVESTAFWDRHPAAMQAAIDRHDALMDEILARCGGRQIKERGEGDSIFAVFTSPSSALAAACELQQALLAEPWPAETPLCVRMGLHTGEAALRGSDYYGATVNRTARIRSLAAGAQILLSQTTYDLLRDLLPAGVALRGLGAHSLKGLQRVEELYQVVHPALPAEFPPLVSPQSPRTNLPVQPTSFIGREREQDEVLGLLDRAPLVTLIGAGGAGKTRLSLAVAARLVEQYPDGVWLVELAALTDAGLVPQAVARMLRLREEPGRPLLATITAALEPRHLLLMLDNCEHLVAACAELATALLSACPAVHLLATSREALEVAGEVTYRVPSLGAPGLAHLSPLEHLSGYEAVQLFLERARARRHDFALAARNARAVAQICAWLDGIPLAIELAAARTSTMSVEAIASRLDDCFRLLTGGPRTALPRQQTLRATLDWSYSLLSMPEQILLNRLSTFTGGWTLEAAEAVCSAEGVQGIEVLDLLSALVNKSMVQIDDIDGPSRYRLLETVRQYGQECLAARGEMGALQGEHAHYYLELAEEADAALRGKALHGKAQAEWLALLEQETDNLRAALRWARESGEAETGLRLAGALWRFWYMRGYVSEGRQWLDELLATDRYGHARASAATRAKALNGAGVLATIQDDLDQATALYEESLALQRELGDRWGIAACLNNLGNVALDRGSYERAAILHEESLALRRESGDRWAVAASLNNLGEVARHQGKFDRAARLYEESLALHREVGDTWGIAGTLSNLASVVEKQGDYDRAVVLHEESLALKESLNDTQGMAVVLSNLGRAVLHQGNEERALALYARSLALCVRIDDKKSVAVCLEGIAGMAAVQRPERAVHLFGAASALRSAIGAPLPPDEQVAIHRDLARARSALAAPAFAAAWAVGRSMSLEQAIDAAIGNTA
jgi:predicted ATPase/class 3 adenylate cyclase/Tfp pilus assembly protein PilF/DNA-binding XRE family transcriptional regulator